MPQSTVPGAPGLISFTKSLKTVPVEPSIEHLISLLKRRQIHNSRPCAIATTALLLRVVGEFKGKDATKLIQRIREVGKRLTAAQPRELVVGNIVRRVLGLVRDVIEDKVEEETNATGSEFDHAHGAHDTVPRPALLSSISTFSPLRHAAIEPTDASAIQDLSESGELPKRPALMSHPSTIPLGNSLFGLFQLDTPSPTSTPPGVQSPVGKEALTSLNLERLGDFSKSKVNLKAEVMDGIRELQEELEQSDDMIASNAVDHIHQGEIILTHTASTSVQKFLLAAAKKRKFTVVHVEAYPNEHTATHATILTGKKQDHEKKDEDPWKPLTSLGITVVLIPDSHVFAIMSRVNKVILATHTVLANGGLVAAAGAHMIARAAKVHETPVVVISGIYKLSPVYPFDIEELIEYGDAGSVVPYQSGEFVDTVDVENPLYDYVPPELVDLYITNLGGHAPSYLYRVVAEHYRSEDVNL